MFLLYYFTVLQCDLLPIRPDHTVGRPGPRNEPGTGGLEAGKLSNQGYKRLFHIAEEPEDWKDVDCVQSFYSKCVPCDVKYNLIIKLESHDNDTEYLIR